MKRVFTVKDIDDLPEAAAEITQLITDADNGGETPYSVVLFYGEMGAGKTTLIKEICGCMNVTDIVTSPTFALVNEYHSEFGNSVYHFDFYRINSMEEVFDIGYEEYIYSDGFSFIEWPQKISPLIPKNGDDGLRVASVTISVNEKGGRGIVFEA